MTGINSYFCISLQQDDDSMALEKIPTAKTFFGIPGQQAAAADYDQDGDVDFVQRAVDELYLHKNAGLNSNGVPEFVLAEPVRFHMARTVILFS